MIFQLLACADTPEEVPFNTFADVHEPRLDINAGNLAPRGPRIQVLVHPELEGVCRALPELQAKVDGVPLTRLHGVYDDGSLRYDRDCFVYEFEGLAEVVAQVADRADNVITVSDGPTTLAATVHHLFKEPRFEAPAEAVAAGAEVSLAFVPTGDVVDASVVVSVELTQDGGSPQSVPARASAEAVVFTLPAELHGVTTVTVFGTVAYSPAITSCVGAAKCAASRVFVAAPVSITVR